MTNTPVDIAGRDMGGALAFPATPLEHYRFLKERLFLPQGQEMQSPSLRTLFSIPFAKKFQLSKALERLTCKDVTTPFLVPIQYPSGAAPLADYWSHPDDQFPKILENCELALLWALIGQKEQNKVFEEASQRLAGWLEPIVVSGLWTLWSKESEYDPIEAGEIIQLFLFTIGKQNCAVPRSPFYAWVHNQNPKILLGPSILEDPSLGYRFYPCQKNPLAIAASGKKTAAGSLRIDAWHVLAFGPHGAPLADLDLFGLNSSGNKEGWFSTVAYPEVWMKVLPEKQEHGWLLKLETVGLTAHRPMSFVFYVSGKVCSIHGRSFKTASLQRYEGDANVIAIEQDGNKFFIETSQTMKLEMIPLSGNEGFWGASFLLSFVLPPFLGTYHFKIFSNDSNLAK